jgi:class 3 adenylate cyclase
VNLASRLEQATKEFHARLLISEAVRRSLDGAISGVEDLGPVLLKGQPDPARIFKVA